MRAVVAALIVVLVASGCGGGQPESPQAESSTLTKQPTGEIAGDGSYTVGTDISPGTWQSAGPQDGKECRWQRVSDQDGADIADNTDPDGPQTVRILQGDRGFETSGCQPWRKID
jgi:hypothetical protein